MDDYEAQELRRVSTHEAAHAIMHAAFGIGIKSASTIPHAKTNTAGRVTLAREQVLEPRHKILTGLDQDTRERLYAKILGYLAGYEAERMVGSPLSAYVPDIWNSSATDHRHASYLARVAAENDDEAHMLIRWLEARCRAIVRRLLLPQAPGSALADPRAGT